MLNNLTISIFIFCCYFNPIFLILDQNPIDGWRAIFNSADLNI